MKNVLLLCHEDSGQEARFQVALDVARAMEGHLTCLDVAVPPLAVTSDYVCISVAAEMTGDAIALERDIAPALPHACRVTTCRGTGSTRPAISPPVSAMSPRSPISSSSAVGWTIFRCPTCAALPAS